MTESRVAIRVPNHLGDCVMSLPLVRMLVQQYGDVSVVTPQMYISLFERIEGVSCLAFENDARHGLAGAWKLAQILRAHDFERIVLLPTSFSSALSALLAGISHRVGYPTDGRAFLLSDMRPASDHTRRLHRSEQYLQLLDTREHHVASLSLQQLSEMIHLEVSAKERAAVRSRLSKNGLASDQKFAVLPFRAVAESRRWGRENYAALAQWLYRERGFCSVLVGSNADQSEGEWLQQQIGDGSINIAGSTSLVELMALMVESALVVGNDSGPSHVAAAVGAPLVVLSGADNPDETSPLSTNKVVLRAASVECLGCVRNRCPKKGADYMRCMSELSLAEVCRAIDTILS